MIDWKATGAAALVLSGMVAVMIGVVYLFMMLERYLGFGFLMVVFGVISIAAVSITYGIEKAKERSAGKGVEGF